MLYTILLTKQKAQNEPEQGLLSQLTVTGIFVLGHEVLNRDCGKTGKPHHST